MALLCAAGGFLCVAAACWREGGVSVDGKPEPWMQHDLQARTERTIQLAAQRWRSEPVSSVAVHFGGDRVCGTALGCNNGDEIWVSDWIAYHWPERWELVLASCVEQSVLVHEVGHLVIGDPGHTDPRWRTGWEELWTELSSAPGCASIPYSGSWDGVQD
ncbi:MAG TPA: hypothetical protein VFE30_06200 [Anaeromyxobacteraceae bacterium]|jgi:hypothetical protein|nr:hypothetical protein [Anaeromyxobacteraceae bacterium]